MLLSYWNAAMFNDHKEMLHFVQTLKKNAKSALRSTCFLPVHGVGRTPVLQKFKASWYGEPTPRTFHRALSFWKTRPGGPFYRGLATHAAARSTTEFPRSGAVVISVKNTKSWAGKAS